MLYNGAMAKKKTKKTAPRRSSDRALRRVAARAQRFADRIDQLDEWIDQGARLDLRDLPLRRDLCEAEYQRRLKDAKRAGDVDGAPTLEEFQRHGWRLDEVFRLEGDLQLAARRLAVLDGYKPEHRAPIDEMLRRCFDRTERGAPKSWHRKSDSDVLRSVLAALRQLVAADGVARADFKTNPKPSPLQAGILDVLLDADGSLSGDEIASKVQRKLGGSKPAKAILAAIGKLRADCGFPELYAGDAGYKLTPDERALAAKLLGK